MALSLTILALFSFPPDPAPPSPIYIDDGRRTPVFWGYVLTPYTISTMLPLLDTNRLAVIFDLDETLLIANTVSSLEKRLDDCQMQMCGGGQGVTRVFVCGGGSAGIVGRQQEGGAELEGSRGSIGVPPVSLRSQYLSAI